MSNLTQSSCIPNKIFTIIQRCPIAAEVIVEISLNLFNSTTKPLELINSKARNLPSGCDEVLKSGVDDQILVDTTSLVVVLATGDDVVVIIIELVVDCMVVLVVMEDVVL